MQTEHFDDRAAFLTAVNGKKPGKTPSPKAKDARPDIPRAPSGEGDRLAQLRRLAAYGFSPRWDVGVGFSFWHPATNARTSAHAAYAAACGAAEKELRG